VKLETWSGELVTTSVFALQQPVMMAESKERGTVIGVAFYADRPPYYLVRYKDATGRQVEDWWAESALKA